ncbi:MAG: hypothetical protein STSR0008_16650 [Ignavibacterium sp.]
MKEELINSRSFAILGLILIVSITRLIPHPANFTPIAAMALFGGTYFNNKKIAFAIPLIIMFLTDMIIGFHENIIAVYLSFVLIVALGFWLQKNKNLKNIILTTLISSVAFFVITNFSVWITGSMYPKNLSGIIECYVAAIPFFRNSVLGDLFYVGVLFGAYELAALKFPALSKIKS